MGGLGVAGTRLRTATKIRTGDVYVLLAMQRASDSACGAAGKRLRTAKGTRAGGNDRHGDDSRLCSGRATPHGDQEPYGRHQCARRRPRATPVAERMGAPPARHFPWLRGDVNERFVQAASRSRSTGSSPSPPSCSATSSARSGTARADVTFPKWTSSGVRCPRPWCGLSSLNQRT